MSDGTTDKDVIADVFSTVPREALFNAPWWGTPVRLGAIVLLYVASAYVAWQLGNPLIWLATWVLQGFFLVCIFSAFHDTVHYSLVKGRLANTVLGWVLGAPILMNYPLYAAYHLEHHRKTGIEGDTEPHGGFESIWEYLRGYIWPDFMIDFWADLLRCLSKNPPRYAVEEFKNPGTRISIVFNVAFIALVLVHLFLFPVQVLTFYVMPLLFYIPWFYFTALPEHYECEETKDFLRNTRTVRSNIFFRFFYFNGNYHAEHHLFPRVPSWNLGKLNEVAGDRVRHRAPTYLGFHADIVRDLLGAGRQGGKSLRGGNGIQNDD